MLLKTTLPVFRILMVRGSRLQPQGHLKQILPNTHHPTELRFSNFPDRLRRLFTGAHPSSRNFIQHARNYNSALAMASMGAQLDIPRRGPYCFRIHGQVYHYVGPLTPREGTRPRFGQIYILDTNEANSERMSCPANSPCDAFLMMSLSTMLHEINVYVQSFKMMGEVVHEEESRASSEQRRMPSIRMIFDVRPELDRRRYNIPIANEVAVVYVGEDDDVPATRSLAVHHRNSRMEHISDIDPRCDPLTYPLLFPRGEPGWDPTITKRRSSRLRTRVSQREYYSYLISLRSSFNPLHHAGKLFQQYLVDSYVKIEQNRLNYARTHQRELRCDSYQGLMDHLMGSEDVQTAAGQRIILPSSFQGGPRAMHQSYQDAMAIVAKYGRPDYFITFTCNPKWREIVENLHEGQTSSDRPDLVARVFYMKLAVLRKQLFRMHILGRVSAFIMVVEWQKRGLPHCHMLLIMTADSKPRSEQQVDAVVNATLPDPLTKQRLHNIVATHMIHRMCVTTNVNAPCMVNGVCSKKFPKEFRDATSVDSDGYPKYRRPNDGRSVSIGDIQYDNRHVVPYNPYISLLLNAHINVEVCGYIQAVKYLYKYVYKGPDRASLRITGQQSATSRNEIDAHLNARYVCAPEAVHHILQYDCQAKSDTVCRLQVHLPNFQTVAFLPGAERAALERAASRNTTLTAWFQLNAEYDRLQLEGALPSPDARTLLYNEVPTHFTFNSASGKWKKRQRGSRQIGRMYTVSPKQLDRFHLRLLLLNRVNMRSFEDLRTVDGVTHGSFGDAARALHLLHDDIHYTACLEEAAQFGMPSELRSIFTYMLAFCEIADPQAMFDRFIAAMSEDYVYQGQSSVEAAASAYFDLLDGLLLLQAKSREGVKVLSRNTRIKNIVMRSILH
ncbi:hypothetical protein Q1695_013657 [Nippostrongylus brasiliensis]|nr:hypothetical protein Q1695_013657 [Nippostrongylus brasiliensis]